MVSSFWFLVFSLWFENDDHQSMMDREPETRNPKPETH